MNIIKKISKSIPGTYLSYGEIKGCFEADTQIIKRLSLDSNNRYAFVEKKTTYYRLMFDFDYKLENDSICAWHQRITKLLIELIIEALNDLIDKPNTEYIVAIKNKGLGVHLYFPNIIVDIVFHKYIYDYCFKLLKINNMTINGNIIEVNIIKKIFDECVCKSNGLRLFYNPINDMYYYPCKELSTFIFPDDKRMHFKYCLVNTNATQYNFELSPDFINALQMEKRLNTVEEINVYTEKYLDNNENKELFMDLVEILSSYRWDKYDTWLDLVFLFRTYDYKDELIEFSKQSNKYNANALSDINKIFNKHLTTKKKTIGSLIMWCKEDNMNETIKCLYQYNIHTKLKIDNMNSILLCDNFYKVDYTENTKYISTDAHNNIIANLNRKCIILQSPTGSGKTHTINILLNQLYEKSNNNDFSICCITSRRTMISTYMNAIKIPSKSGSNINFISYLTDNNSLDDYFISSLEHMANIKRQYNVIVLDEITSLIRHYYSETMDGKRLRSFVNLINLLQDANYIICCDAIMTDYVFTLFDSILIHYYYYRNEYKISSGKNMIIYDSKTFNEMLEIKNFLKPVIRDIKAKKSVIIFSDSKKMTEQIFIILQEYNNDISYYLLINRDSTELDTITQCNETFVNKCVIISPRIVYGLDIQIPYENIYCIYKNCTKINGMSALEYHQQINRCRQAKNIHILFTKQEYYRVNNMFIPFESFCEIENKKYEEYNDNINIMNRNYKLVDELCSTVKINGKTINYESLFTPIHYKKAWYDILFSKNKMEIIELLAKEAGYNIIKKQLVASATIDKKKINMNIKEFDINKKKEISTIASSIVENDYYDVANKQLLEQLLIRANLLKINNCPNLKEILGDERKFTTFINRKYLDLTYDEFNKFKVSKDKNDISIINKDHKLINKIDLIFWLEKLLGNNRYDVDMIECDDADTIKEELLKKVNELILLSDGVKSKSGLIKLYKTKICKLNGNAMIKAFMADCYNSFGDIIQVTNKRIRNKETNKLDYIKLYKLLE